MVVVLRFYGPFKTWYGGVDCATGAGDVCKCTEPRPCWWGVQWRVWSEGWCSPRISTQPAALHHCAWSLITRVRLWGPLGGPLCRWPCYHRWIAWGLCQEALDLERRNGEERTENAGKTKIMICGTGLDLLQSSGDFPCAVCRTGVGSNSIFCNGCKHWVHKKCSGLKRLKKDPDYRCTWCQGTARPLDGRPQKEVQVGPDKLEVVASFCYQGDMQVAVNFQPQHMWKQPGRSSRICYQSSLHATSLSKHVAVCTALVCGAQCSMPARLGHWQSPTSSVCSEMTGQWSDRSAMSGRKTLSPPGPMSYLCSLALRIWTSFWRREDSDGMDMWNAPVVQSRQPLTYRLMESVWKAQNDMEAADREGLQRVEALGYQPSW